MLKLKFTPRVDSYILEYIKNKENIKNVVNMCGSPCNLIFPELIDKNIKAFESVFKKYNIKGKIFYAHKVNKSNSLVKQARYNKIGIDVASENELKSAVSNGYTGDMIEATGPKSDSFIILGLEHLVTFNVDSIEELNTIIKYAKKILKNEKNKKVKILLRLNNFKSQELRLIDKQTKFGINIDNIENILSLLYKNKDIVNLVGFSFHIDSTDIKPKIVAIQNIIKLFQLSYEYGLDPYAF